MIGLLFFAGCTTAPRRTFIDNQPAILPARIISNLFVVESKWDDGRTYRFLIDTGSTATLIAPELAKRFATKEKGPSKRHVRVRSALGGDVDLEAITLRKLTLGTATFESVPALIFNCDELSAHLGLTIDGIIGFPVFKNTLLTIDYPGQRLVVAPHSPTERRSPLVLNATTLVFNNDQRTPLIPIQMGNESLNALIDTGSDGSLGLNPTGLHPLFAFGPRIGTIVSSIQGDRRQLTGRLRQDVLIGTHTITRPIVDLTENLSSIGGEILKNFTLTFDQSSNLVTFTASDDNLITIQPRRSTGLSFSRSPVYWRVLTVIPDTPTADLSVQAGDLCVRINGEPVEKWGYERYAALLKSAAKITYTFLKGPSEFDLEVPLFELVP